MDQGTTVVGLDVHKQRIVGAVLPWGSDRVTEKVVLENRPQEVERFVTRVAGKGPVEFVYEAGPCGYEVQRQIAGLGYRCVVVAPGMTPVRPGDRVKTDLRDAEKLARYYRAGELREIRVPSREEEAARDLPRVREDVLKDLLRAKNRLGKFLLRQGRVYAETRTWGVKHRSWLRTQRFEWTPLQQSFEAYLRAVEEAEFRLETLNHQLEELVQQDPYRVPVQYLRCFRGIDSLSALTLVVEAMEFKRFGTARKFMSYTGAVSSENSSANRVRRGSITKAGNAHIRRILVEAAWSYQHPHGESRVLAERRKECPREVVYLARKAQDRLSRKFRRMIHRNKRSQVAAVAVARELAGFVWAMAQHFPLPAAA